MQRWLAGLCVGVTLVICSQLNAASVSVSTVDGRGLTVDAGSGEFQITTRRPDWIVGGTIGKTLSDVSTSKDQDSIGSCQVVQFSWDDNGKRSGSIRLYDQRPVVLFSVKYETAVDGSPTPFPTFSRLPAHLMAFRYGEKDHLLPELFHLQGSEPDEQYSGPISLFDDDANALIVSPASNFMISMMSGDFEHGISSGLNRTLSGVPAGYEHKTLLAIGPGINETWKTWGHALTDLYGKKRPANDSDTGLKYLGFWTDNGAYYYYNYDLDKGYAGTLLYLRDYLKQHGIPIHYLQLDSWFYPKTFQAFVANESNRPRSKDPRLPAGDWNRYGGLLEYTGSRELFPQGIAAFTHDLGLPLITHNRWIDPESPYRKQYKISGIAPVDPAYWEKIISDIASWGVQTYEQDWNNYLYLRSPELMSTTWAADAFMDGMAKACAEHNLTMQYCMIMPRNLMQGGAKYSNLTTVRVSGDRLERRKWREFLYGSEMSGALGVWPWTDVFKSSETPNILIATLSGGMVGISDKAGDENAENIFRAVRKDGVIVKPDEPLVPTDATFIAEGKMDGQPTTEPLIFTTHSGSGAEAAYYVFACERDPKSKDAVAWTLDPASLGIKGPALAYDFLNPAVTTANASHPIGGELKNGDDFAYRVVVPIGASGMALIGDAGKFVTRGKQRIAASSDDGKALHASVVFAPGESSVSLAVYCAKQPKAEAKGGTVGQVKWDESTSIATVEVNVGPATAETTADVTIQ